jgi:hypothetical protein
MIGQTGEESIKAYINGDPKACIITMSCISAAGNKLPLFFVPRGKTP